MTAVTCWGDSLTFGTGSTAGNTYPSMVSSLLAGQVANNFGVPGDTSAQVETLVVANSANRNDVVLFWVGHNDATFPPVAANVAACVASLSPNTKFLVLSTITRTYQPIGTSDYDAVIALNAAMATTYGSKFVDVLGTLVNAYNPSDATDVSCFVQGLIPNSLRATADTIHLNSGGYAVIARLVSQAIYAQGWAEPSTALNAVLPTATEFSSEVLTVYTTASGVNRPKNILLRSASALRSSYVSAGYDFGQRALLDVQADIAARAAG